MDVATPLPSPDGVPPASLPQWLIDLSTVVTAIGAALTAIVAVVALVIAVQQVKEAKRARVQAAYLDAERSQPYVVAYMEASGATPALIDLVIKNYGVTAAYDVRFTVEPWPARVIEPSGPLAVPENIPVLAPGQEWRTLWDSGFDRNRDGVDMPKEHRGSVKFRGLNDVERESAVTLDWNIYSGRRWVTVHTVHDVAKQLKDIADTVSKWTEGLHGLSVTVRDGDKQDAEFRAELAAEADKDDAAHRAFLEGESTQDPPS